MMKAAVLIIAFAIEAFAQQTVTVSGRVVLTDPSLERARVTLISRSDSKIKFEIDTEPDGQFRFTEIPPGRYALTATGKCKNTVALCAPFVAAQRIDAAADVPGLVLQLQYVNLYEEVVVIAADDEQRLSEISKTVNVIEGQEMRDRADFTLIDTVRTIPGFRVQQLGGFGRTASIKSRGLRNQDTAVLLDGIRFRDPGSITGDATPFLSDFTLTSVSRIEVLRGSGSSLYGTNAVGGTIDFQTPQARSGVHGQIGGAFGGLGLGRFRGNVSYGVDDRFGISGGISRTAYTKGIDGEDNAGNTNVQSRVDYKPSPKTDLSARFFVADANVRLNVSPDTFGTLPPVGTIIDAREGINFIHDQNDPDSTQDSRFFSGQFGANHAVSDQFVISGYFQGLVTKRTNEDGVLGPGFQSAFTSSFGGTIYTGNVHATWTPNGSNTFTAGYEHEAERFRNAGATPSSSEGSTPSGTDSFWTRASQRSHTLYAQHRVGFLDGNLQLAGGARAQWFSLGTPEFSEPDSPYADATLDDPPAAYTFDGSASYYISRTGTKFRTHVGNGYRVPSLYERFGTFFFFGSFFAQGNPELKPERSLGIDAGVEQYFADQKVKLSATYFYTKVKDEITYLPTSDFTAPVYYNFDRHYSRGIETSVDIRPTRSTQVFASYTFANSDIRAFRRPSDTTVASRDRIAFGIPDHQLTIVATQRFDRFWVTFDFLATSSYLAPVFSSATFAQYTYRFEGNRRADLTAGYTFPLKGEKLTLRLFGTIENMFDNEYFENGFRTPGMNGRVGVSFGF